MIEKRHKRDKCHHKAAQYKEYQEQPGEEYDLGTAYYGAYLVRNSDSGAAALIMVGAGVSSNILLSDGNSISTDFTAGGKIILNKKTSNGNVYVKNGRSTEAYIHVMQITNY